VSTSSLRQTSRTSAAKVALHPPSAALAPADDPLLTTHDVAKRWGRTEEFVISLRKAGVGPRFLKLSERTTRYRLSDLIAYEDSLRFASQAEAMAHRADVA
jgi:hypothetical protein